MSTISPAPNEPRLRGTHVPISEALRRYAPVVAVATLLLAGLGVAWGLYRTPVYTATSENVVRALSPSVAQLPGAIQAAQDLASNQSRLIDSDGITTPSRSSSRRRAHTSPPT